MAKELSILCDMDHHDICNKTELQGTLDCTCKCHKKTKAVAA
jgi:hypothetical protein